MKRHGIMGALLLAAATFMTAGASYAQDTTTDPNGTQQQGRDVLRERAAPPGCVPSANGGTTPSQPGVTCPGPSPISPPVVPLPQAPGGTPGMPGDRNVRPPGSVPAPGTPPVPGQPAPGAVTPGQPTPGTVTPGTGMAPAR
jgi:hypothetical protein